MAVSASILQHHTPAVAVAAACALVAGVAVYFYGYWFSYGLA